MSNTIGVNFKIDVAKLDKARFFKANSGAIYCDLTCFIDLDNQDSFGQNGGITQGTTAEERQQGVKLPFIGNVKVFYKDQQQSQAQQPVKAEVIAQSFGGEIVDADNQELPF